MVWVYIAAYIYGDGGSQPFRENRFAEVIGEQLKDEKLKKTVNFIESLQQRLISEPKLSKYDALLVKSIMKSCQYALRNFAETGNFDSLYNEISIELQRLFFQKRHLFWRRQGLDAGLRECVVKLLGVEPKRFVADEDIKRSIEVYATGVEFGQVDLNSTALENITVDEEEVKNSKAVGEGVANRRVVTYQVPSLRQKKLNTVITQRLNAGLERMQHHWDFMQWRVVVPNNKRRMFNALYRKSRSNFLPTVKLFSDLDEKEFRLRSSAMSLAHCEELKSRLDMADLPSATIVSDGMKYHVEIPARAVRDIDRLVHQFNMAESRSLEKKTVNDARVNATMQTMGHVRTGYSAVNFIQKFSSHVLRVHVGLPQDQVAGLFAGSTGLSVIGTSISALTFAAKAHVGLLKGRDVTNFGMGMTSSALSFARKIAPNAFKGTPVGLVASVVSGARSSVE